MFTVFDHTADLGLRVTEPDLNALFAEAGRGLTWMITEDLDAIKPAREVSISLALPTGTDEEREYLLFDWLKELLYRFDADMWLFAEFDVRVTESGLEATAFGEPYDPARHELMREVKAITYHDLSLRQTPDGWVAEVIVDI